MILTLIAVVAMALLAVVLVRPSIVTRNRAGRILAFMALFILPTIAALMGLDAHVEHSKTTGFCLSCHVMSDYGKSLLYDDVLHIPASHYQNGRVPRDTACFTCHTNYTMYGDFNAKLRGLRHVYVQYLGTVPKTLALYSPYDNRECLHCHEHARAFQEAVTHQSAPGRMASIQSNRLSCLTSQCHSVVHDVAHVNTAAMWKEGK